MSNVSSIPNGMHTVTPHLVCAGAAEAIEFYKKVFNATETSRLPGPNGRLMHASIRIGDSTILASDGNCSGQVKPQGFALSLTARDAAALTKVAEPTPTALHRVRSRRVAGRRDVRAC